ncbi:TIGR01906 family membrane protein [Clostridium aestuarii]|uniref:TIGR01906 family membrane protein n=1 Tax=Clostridium aestuarii TaxID=338193 RepID=UPI003AF0E6DB
MRLLKKSNHYIYQILLTICILLLFPILSLKFTLNFKPLYYSDVVSLNISQISNLDTNEIKLNYDYIINYLQNPNNKEFELPTLHYSDKGKIHFEEVKSIFNKLNFIFYILIFIILITLSLNWKSMNFSFFKWSSIYLLFIPLTLLLAFLINFDKSFTFFHKIFFNNDYWLLDPKTDPIINILPQEFFFHCGIIIVFLMFIWSFILYFVYRKLTNYFSF